MSMSVETTAKFISELNETLPRSADFIKEGDDHIRLIKDVLKNSFPNINKAVNLTADQMNNLASQANISNDTMELTTGLKLGQGKTLDLNSGKAINSGLAVNDGDLVSFAFLKNYVTTIIGKTRPIGSLYFTEGTEDPTTTFGGTWVKYAAGRVIVGAGVGADTVTTKTFVNGETGGEYNHTLSITELTPHSHTSGTLTANTSGKHRHNYTDDDNVASNFTSAGVEYVQGLNGGGSDGGGHQCWYRTSESGDHTHPITGSTGQAGGGNGHNNIQPYITVNIWKRTA